MRADRDAVTIRGWRRQTALEVHGNGADIALQFRSHVTANNKLPFQAWRQPIFLGKPGRKVAVIRGIPAANFVAVVVGKAVAAPIVVIIMVLVLVAPVAIVLVIAVVFIRAPGDGLAWVNVKDNCYVIRGGAWDYLPSLLRSSWRDWRPADFHADNLGFRVAARGPKEFTGK